MNSRELFESSLSTIEEVVASVCRRARLRGADAEDFASSVRVRLLEDDCAILRKYEGRSSLAGYLTVVISRMLSDERERTMGRWYPSTEATRLGPAAVLLEQLLLRDRRSFEEAVPIMRGAHPDVSRTELERIAQRLPHRNPRPRFVELDGDEVPPIASSESVEDDAMSAEARQLSARTAQVVRETLASFTEEDRALIHLHYASSMSIADLSRVMRLPQRPLYRRFERLLVTMRTALTIAGIGGVVVDALIANAVDEGMDLGLPRSVPLQWKEGA